MSDLSEYKQSTALENIDAYLDGEELSEEEAHKLEQWIKTDSENADQAFRRVFLHSYLRQRFQTRAIGERQARELESRKQEPLILPSESEIEIKPEPQPQTKPTPAKGRRHPLLTWRWFLLIGIGLVSTFNLAVLFIKDFQIPYDEEKAFEQPINFDSDYMKKTFLMARVAAQPFLYEGFDYSKKELLDKEAEGVNGLDGGVGWAGASS